MAKHKNGTATANASGANVGYETELWQMADALRGSMDAAEYKHVVLGLIFLKFISDAFEEQHTKLVAEKAQGADPEDSVTARFPSQLSKTQRSPGWRASDGRSSTGWRSRPAS